MKFFLLGVVCAIVIPLSAQITLVEKQRPVARICVVGDTDVDKQAADLLRDFVHRISRANLPIVNHEKPRNGYVVIGETHVEAGEDGFLLKTENDRCTSVREATKEVSMGW